MSCMFTLAPDTNSRNTRVISDFACDIRDVRWPDMAAAVRLALDHLEARIGDRLLHIIGYSTGAALALDAFLEVIEQGVEWVPVYSYLEERAVDWVRAMEPW